jgi:hypothetical protein
VPVGPLAVRWLGYELPVVRAGTYSPARVELENAGSATWRSHGTEGVQLAYHWLDPLANPILWDGIRTALPRPVGPGERIELPVELQAPRPPGRYRLAFDLVHEHRFWFAEVGSAPLEVDVDVSPRLVRRAIAVRVGDGPSDLVEATLAALRAQTEELAEDSEAVAHLAAGCRPDPDWASRLLDLHAEGWAAAGGSVEVKGRRWDRRPLAGLDPWRPGFGRSPEWSRPLLCPSLLFPAPLGELHGLPAVDPAELDEPAICDGRARVVVEARALLRARRPGA